MLMKGSHKAVIIVVPSKALILVTVKDSPLSIFAIFLGWGKLVTRPYTVAGVFLA